MLSNVQNSSDRNPFACVYATVKIDGRLVLAKEAGSSNFNNLQIAPLIWFAYIECWNESWIVSSKCVDKFVYLLQTIVSVEEWLWERKRAGTSIEQRRLIIRFSLFRDSTKAKKYGKWAMHLRMCVSVHLTVYRSRGKEVKDEVFLWMHLCTKTRHLAILRVMIRYAKYARLKQIV